MIECKIESVRASRSKNVQLYAVALRAADSGRCFHIWTGIADADAIAWGLQGITTGRPTTFKLANSIVNELGATVESVLISDLVKDRYFARITLVVSGHRIDIDARPSDALALALEAKCPIFVEDAVLKKVEVLSQA